MIIGIVGFPGAGKSTLTARMALEDLKRGRPICCNKAMNGAEHVPNFPDILRWCSIHHNGTVYIEEAGVFMRGRTKQVPEEILDLAAQARHLGIDLVLNFQHAMQIEPEMLRLMQVIYTCKKLFAGFPSQQIGAGLHPVTALLWPLSSLVGRFLPSVRGKMRAFRRWVVRVFPYRVGGGYWLNPLLRFVAREPGEREPLWGHVHVLDWVIWRPAFANVFKRALVGKSVHSDIQLKRASFDLQNAEALKQQDINLR